MFRLVVMTVPPIEGETRSASVRRQAVLAKAMAAQARLEALLVRERELEGTPSDLAGHGEGRGARVGGPFVNAVHYPENCCPELE